jgi:hypothetical protein
MIELLGKLEVCDPVSCGSAMGFITWVDAREYGILWLDGNTTTQLRPDLDEEEV